MFLDPYLDLYGETDLAKCRELYKTDKNGDERDFREFGNKNTDPGDIYKFFVRVKKAVLYNYIENELLLHGRPRFLEHLFPEITAQNYIDSETEY